MNLRAVFFTTLIFMFFTSIARSQWPVLPNGRFLNPSDNTIPYSHIDFSGELYNFVKGKLWQFNISGSLSLFKGKHELNIKVPFIRSEYSGIENLSGIGDIAVRWKILTYESKLRVRTLASSAFYLELSIPTGNEFSGHGTGVPLLIPGFMLAYRPVQQIAIFPHIRYIHSVGNANSDWGGGISGGFPSDPDETARKIRVLQAEIFFNVEFNEAWTGIAPGYSYEFNGGEGTLNIRPELGKLFAETLALKLSGSFYVAGRRRLLNWTMFSVNYFFR